MLCFRMDLRGNGMTPQERRTQILEELKSMGKVDVNALSERFRCSKVTIRTDIRSLEKDGLLTRTHGGAVSQEEEDKSIYTYKSIYRNTANKEEIARCAFQFVEDRDTIYLDDSSTSFYLAVELKKHPEKRLAIVTNSLLVGNELAECNHLEIYIVSGHVSGNPAASHGEETERQILSYHLDKAFIGVHSINLEVGLTSIATPQMQVKRAVLKAARDVYVLADSSKFGGGYVTVVCPVTAVHKIITDADIRPEYVRGAQKLHVPLVIAPRS